MRVTSAPGEYSALNELTAPPGAALRAVNVVVDEPDEYSTHPGLEALPTWVGHPITAFTYWRSVLVAHSESTGKLAYLSGGVWTEVTGTYNAPAGEVMDFATLQGALYFTTSTGVFRIVNVGVDPEPCGIEQGLTGTGATAGASGFLPEGEAVAYRWHWAKNVENDTDEGRLVEGAPGGRLVVVNATGSGSSKNVDLEIPIPEGLPAGAYLRVFRSDAVLEDVLPTDEVRQVYEREPTATELAAGVLTFTDTTPEAVRGSSAYYSANTGDGLGASNFPAPLCRALEVFSSHLMGICVTGIQRLTLNMLGVDATGTSIGLRSGQVILVEAGSTLEAYNANVVAENFPVGDFFLATGGTAAQNIAATVDSLVRLINYQPSGLLWAKAIDTDGSTPGSILLEARSLDTPAFEVFTNMGSGQAFAPALRAYSTPFSFQRTANVVTVDTNGPHGFVVDQDVTLSYTPPFVPLPDFPAGTFTVASTPTPDTFTYAQTGADTGVVLSGGGFADLRFESGDGPVRSSPGTAENAYAWSIAEQPDHWPLSNYGTVGNARSTLLWGLPMDRYIFMGSEDGLFRVQSDGNGGFGLVDNGVWNDTFRFVGRRNVAKVGGRAYAMSRAGIVGWSETAKPQPVDGPIQEEIRAHLAQNEETIAESGYFVADEVERRLYVFIPLPPGGQYEVRILNVDTGAWTRIDATFPGLEDGTQGPAIAPSELGGQLHVLPTNGTDGEILRVRNTATSADFRGPSGEAIPSSVQYLPWTAGEPERQKHWTHVRIFTRAPTTEIQFSSTTNLYPTLQTQDLPDMGPLFLTAPEPVSDPVRGLMWKSLVDQEHMCGHAASFKVSHATAGEQFRLLGLDVAHRAYGP